MKLTRKQLRRLLEQEAHVIKESPAAQSKIPKQKVIDAIEDVKDGSTRIALQMIWEWVTGGNTGAAADPK